MASDPEAAAGIGNYRDFMVGYHITHDGRYRGRVVWRDTSTAQALGILLAIGAVVLLST